ncbi:Hypothetical predicted protein [Lynx pardinus]|uniref:Uncharacterized protein n=1 Tax=Lynx pardinus TaxID=191816 RepID=A0A485P4X6_LYNPA|nr:Hypothetical predicted protein [Lynx pardinus]
MACPGSSMARTLSRAPGPGRCPCRIKPASTSAGAPSSARTGWSLLPTVVSGHPTWSWLGSLTSTQMRRTSRS